MISNEKFKINIQNNNTFLDSFDTLKPREVLESLNFNNIQERIIERINFDVTDIKKHKKEFCKLCLDDVYNFTKEIGYYNIEIELNKENQADINIEDSLFMLKKLIIINDYPFVKVWKHSKFLTVNAIEQLAKENDFNTLLDSNNHLTDYGLFKVDKIITNGNS